jgi:hypothetical protein
MFFVTGSIKVRVFFAFGLIVFLMACRSDVVSPMGPTATPSELRTTITPEPSSPSQAPEPQPSATVTSDPAGVVPLSPFTSSVAHPTCEPNAEGSLPFDPTASIDALFDMESYQFRTVYATTMDDAYLDNNLALEIYGAHDDPVEGTQPSYRIDDEFWLGTAFEQFGYFSFLTPYYGRSYFHIKDLNTQQATEHIITSEGFWLRQTGEALWTEFLYSDGWEDINFVDVFEPQRLILFLITGEDLHNVLTASTIEEIGGDSVIHYCGLVESAALRQTLVYTVLEDAQIHLWVGEDDARIRRFAVIGDRSGDWINDRGAFREYDPAPSLYVSVEITGVNELLTIDPPADHNDVQSMAEDGDSQTPIEAPITELPLPPDAVPIDSQSYFEGGNLTTYWDRVFPEFLFGTNTLEAVVFMLKDASQLAHLPFTRRPVYLLTMDPVQAARFIVNEMTRRGWTTDIRVVQIGQTRLLLDFERGAARMPIFIDQVDSESVIVWAILPPEEALLESIVSGWSGFSEEELEIDSNAVNGFVSDRDGQVWLVIDYRGLSFQMFDGSTRNTDLTLFRVPDTSDFISLDLDVQERLWIRTREALHIQDGDSWQSHSQDEIGFKGIFVRTDPLGRGWLLSIGLEALQMFDGTTWHLNLVEGSPLDSKEGIYAPNAVDFEQDGTIWIGTNGAGVFSFDGDVWVTHLEPKGPPDRGNELSINTLAIDGEGQVWVGSGEGLRVFDGASWTVYNRENSIVRDQDVVDIQFDPLDRMWVVTGRGHLYMLDPEGVWTDYSPIRPEDRFSVFSTLWHPSLVFDGEGRLWIVSTLNGLRVFEPPAP